MTTTTLVKTARTVFASATVTAGAPSRGRQDLQTAMGGVLTMKITNGATGPTIACQANVLIAHNATQPAAASAGADWKTVAVFVAGVTNNGVYEFVYDVAPSVMGIEVEFTGNTAQNVTAEAFMSELTNATS